MSAVRRAVLLPVRAYQVLISSALPARCRYYPTCSQYAVEAIGRFGILRGVVLACWRLLRCNPFSAGGLDPISSQRLFHRRRSHA
ncbi:MAG: membrane protein insertion efficiency factor YidD [Actinomycetota bacterium]|nr:membrane protein insertion efficiency factor YidD [Actinomycetota bacterium]